MPGNKVLVRQTHCSIFLKLLISWVSSSQYLHFFHLPKFNDGAHNHFLCNPITSCVTLTELPYILKVFCFCFLKYAFNFTKLKTIYSKLQERNNIQFCLTKHIIDLKTHLQYMTIRILHIALSPFRQETLSSIIIFL